MLRLPRNSFFRAALLAGAVSFGAHASLRAQTAAPYSQIIVFGDSLSDTGNFAEATDDQYGIRYPSNDFNYADGRFTDDGNTSPAASKYQGVWHEQLAKLFLNMTPAAHSLDSSGTDYAYGDAETSDGQRDVSEDGVDVHIDNLQRQVSNYLDSHPTGDASALYILWCGSNDLFEDDSDANVQTAAQNVANEVQRLAEAGARTFLVNNLPPLGLTPDYNSGNASAAQDITQAASDFATYLNTDLDNVETALANENITVTLKRLDIFDLFYKLVANEGINYGFANIMDSAQGNSVKADQYLFWDDVHPTTYGHYQIACEAYTLLTGIPVLQIYENDKHIDRNIGEKTDFLITRTGMDFSSTFVVSLAVSGNAISGTDYKPINAMKTFKAGVSTALVKVKPTTTSDGAPSVKVKLTLEPGTGYTLPVMPTGTVNLDTTEQ